MQSYKTQLEEILHQNPSVLLQNQEGIFQTTDC